MIVLLTGATGFIGQHLSAALLARGHEVVAAGRSRPAGASRFVQVDFAREHDPSAWKERLVGVDAVVNAVGILRETGDQTFDALHRAAPCALFRACAAAGIARVVQVSALGADEAATSGYHLSKRAADRCLAALPLPSVIVQPSLVYGPGGTSARLFDRLASLPVIPLPGDGAQRVQPIHVDDAVQALVALLESGAWAHPGGRRIALVGPEPLALREFLRALRAALGLGPARFARVPPALVRAAAAAGSRLRGTLLDRETLGMLERGNVADPADTRALLGHDPRPARRFVAPGDAPAARMAAVVGWQLVLLRASLAAVWIVTGIVSLGLYPVEESRALLARVGASGVLATVLLYGAAALDLALGVATLALAHARWLWVAQIVLVLGYTAIISLRLPEFWLHPYGPVLKNVPILAILWLLLALEPAATRR